MTSTSTIRQAGGKVWRDSSLSEWPDNDYRIFVGNLGNEVTDEMLAASFKVYASYQRSRVVRDKRTMKTRGYGFVSFTDPVDMLSALREMNNKYIGNRPCMLKRSKWEDRSVAPSSGTTIPQPSSDNPSGIARKTQKFKKIKQ
jgi:RNA recognition motif-containing protein